MHAGSFFQAAALGGSGAAWPIGHAATVTFEADTNMAALSIDYGSMNSYVVLQADPACKPANGAPCATRLSKAKPEAKPEAGAADVPKVSPVVEVIETTDVELPPDEDAMKKATDMDFYFLSMIVLATSAVVLVLMAVTKVVRARRTVAVEAVDVKIEPVTPSSRC